MASFGEVLGVPGRKCRYYDRSKRREPLTQRRNVTFHNTFLSITAVRTSKLALYRLFVRCTTQRKRKALDGPIPLAEFQQMANEIHSFLSSF